MRVEYIMSINRYHTNLGIDNNDIISEAIEDIQLTSVSRKPISCAILYSTLLYSTLPYSTLLYSHLLHSSRLYSTLLYSTLLYCSELQYSITFRTCKPTVALRSWELLRNRLTSKKELSDLDSATIHKYFLQRHITIRLYNLVENEGDREG